MAARRTPRAPSARPFPKSASGIALDRTRRAATDDFGYKAVENKVEIHDLHATMLHLLGLDHEKLTYRYAGRDFRLTDVKGSVAKGIIA